jgi:hypothetical protein
MTKICQKMAQDFHRAVSRVFDRVKSVALAAGSDVLATGARSYIFTSPGMY